VNCHENYLLKREEVKDDSKDPNSSTGMKGTPKNVEVQYSRKNQKYVYG